MQLVMTLNPKPSTLNPQIQRRSKVAAERAKIRKQLAGLGVAKGFKKAWEATRVEREMAIEDAKQRIEVST